MEEKVPKKKTAKLSFNSICEESEESTEINIEQRRNKSHGKLINSKGIKLLKKNTTQKSCQIISVSSSPSLKNVPKTKASISDYTKLKELGQGSYGKVILCKSKEDGKMFAIKEIKKHLLNSLEKQYEIHIEKYCLVNLKHPNIIKFKKAFQDKSTLYFVLEYCKNGDLNRFLQKIGKCLTTTTFWTTTWT